MHMCLYQRIQICRESAERSLKADETWQARAVGEGGRRRLLPDNRLTSSSKLCGARRACRCIRFALIPTAELSVPIPVSDSPLRQRRAARRFS